MALGMQKLWTQALMPGHKPSHSCLCPNVVVTLKPNINAALALVSKGGGDVALVLVPKGGGVTQAKY